MKHSVEPKILVGIQDIANAAGITMPTARRRILALGLRAEFLGRRGEALWNADRVDNLRKAIL